MENKKVGLLIIGIAAIVSIIVYIFNKTLRGIVDASCVLGNQCVMHDSMNAQFSLSLAVVLIIFIIGLYIMFSRPEEKTIIKKIKQKVKQKQINLSGLGKIEKEAIKIIQKEGNAMFQKDLMEKLNVGKVKMTRLIDKLEAKDIVIRKRRGMNNIVVIKDYINEKNI